MEKTFAQVQVGENFSVNGLEYTKIEAVKVSCCQSVNAVAVGNTSNRTFFAEDKVVTVNG
jgi:hypothetical protein